MIFFKKNYLIHYGTKRHSGRYPWGSGGNESGTTKQIQELLNKGYSYKDIANKLGTTASEIKSYISYSKTQETNHMIHQIAAKKQHGYSNVEIAKQLGVSEGLVRYYSNKQISEKKAASNERVDKVSKSLESILDKHIGVDVGTGVNVNLNLTNSEMNKVIVGLKDKGYKVEMINVPDPTNRAITVLHQILTKESVTGRDLHQSINDIVSVNVKANKVSTGTKPISISKTRVAIKHDPSKDGMIYIRPGVKDIFIPVGKTYCQARILVGENKYLKGMAVYSDDIPKGKDVQFFHSKATDSKALKDIEKGINIFGSNVYQYEKNGVQSAINVVGSKPGAGVEGYWDGWNSARNLSTQFLAKQPPKAITERIRATKLDLAKELKDINSISNPTIKSWALENFSLALDKKAASMDVSAFPRQSNKVIFGIDIKDNEVYAPTYNSGETIALVRYPHAGTFEIPVLKVNNNNPSGRKILGNAIDAIGISAKSAAQLSGADYDGDTVIAIPAKYVKATAPVKSLIDFDPRKAYPNGPTTPRITEKQKQEKMGEITNLISDATIRGASVSELTRLVKHSMVVIDSYKHNLDYKQSEIDNDIASLKKKYRQTASIISDAKSPAYVNRELDTSAKGRSYSLPIDSKGNIVYKESTTKRYKSKVDKISLIDNPEKHYTSSNGVESSYASYSEHLKNMARSARLQSAKVSKAYSVNEAAAKEYKNEIASISYKLGQFERSKAAERQVNRKTLAKSAKSDDTTKAEQIRANYRKQYGVAPLQLTKREAEALAKGALPKSTVVKALKAFKGLNYSSFTKSTQATTKLQASNVKRYKNLGYNYSEIANILGISVDRVKQYL